MGVDTGLIPTSPVAGPEYQRWSAVYAGDDYYYGSEPGPVARRAVRYHRQYRPRGGTALDAGCGEGQDLAFLAEQGYVTTGVELTESGAAKAERLLMSRGLEAEIICADLRRYEPAHRFDLVIAVNSVQFLGSEADACLRRLLAAVSPGGVCGISIFSPECRSTGPVAAKHREAREVEPTGGLRRLSLEELMAFLPGWQMLEAAQVWQWNPHTNQPQPFATLIARNVPQARNGPSLALP
jgi:SAM-dependent methyltransferase